MAERDIVEEINIAVPPPKLDREMITELANIVGLGLPSFTRDEALHDWNKVQMYMTFVESLTETLGGFYNRALKEKTNLYSQEFRNRINAHEARRLERAIESACFLTEFLRDFDWRDPFRTLSCEPVVGIEDPLSDFDRRADDVGDDDHLVQRTMSEEAVQVIEDVAAALHSYRSDLDLWRDLAPSRRGRKSNENLRLLVFGLVRLYERYSGKHFTFFRHRERGEYVAVTDGHRFVLRAAQVWIGNAIDAKSLAVECERVNTHWKRMFTSSW
jgi:hypothetical protein